MDSAMYRSLSTLKKHANNSKYLQCYLVNLFVLIWKKLPVYYIPRYVLTRIYTKFKKKKKIKTFFKFYAREQCLSPRFFTIFVLQTRCRSVLKSNFRRCRVSVLYCTAKRINDKILFYNFPSRQCMKFVLYICPHFVKINF